MAGAILLISGIGYGLIGIKNQWVHTFLSTAYLGALGTTVLIIYLMTLPVSKGIQGAYVVAAVLTGAILGGGACIFKEITEAFGSMLGGFCISMWLLTLADGGLVKSTGPKAVFIAAFTAASFATYFSQHSRAYGLIASIAFSGATVVVLGIDCFSRAGLKEFWAYLWELNEDLFPLGAHTYPITKGMKAESAIIVIIFLIGIVSQMQLWKVIKEHRAKSEAARAADERDLQQEEEAVGRQIEKQNAHERKQWEATYGNGEPLSPSATSGDSSLRVTKQKTASGNSQSTRAEKQPMIEECVEISDVHCTTEQTPTAPPKPKTAAEMVTKVNADGTLTVRVATDDMPNGPEEGEETQEKAWVVGANGNPLPASLAPERMSQDVPPSPEVVPLPFKVPKDGGDEKSVVKESSVATFNDVEEDSEGPAVRHHSMSKRLSQSSTTPLRKLSHHTASQDSPHLPTRENLVSNEELIMMLHDESEDGRRSSIAATIDGMSSEGNGGSVRDSRPISIEIRVEDAEGVAKREESVVGRKAKNLERTEAVANDEKRGNVLEDDAPDAAKTLLSKQKHLSGASLGPSDAVDERANAVGKPAKTCTNAEDADASRARSSVLGASMPVDLTKDRLPKALSRIALSYRTNEWAKHLSHADAPKPDTLQLNDYPRNVKKEAAAPLDVTDLLQLGAENRTPPPAIPPPSDVTNAPARPVSRNLCRNSSWQPIPTAPTNNAPVSDRAVSSHQQMSTDIAKHPVVEEIDEDQGATAAAMTSLQANDQIPSSRTSLSVERPSIPTVVSYSSAQTLIGQREMLLRNKSMVSVAGASGPMAVHETAPCEVGSVHNYPTNSAEVADVDDLPLSKRRELIRQSSLQALEASIPRPSSMNLGAVGIGGFPPARMSTPALTAEAVPFNSHQPKRDSSVPQAARDARLASFRQSVANDLRNGSPVLPLQSKTSNPYTNGGLLGSGSMISLVQHREGEASVQESINAQRSQLLSQKQAEMARKEAERAGREKQNKAFEQRMRSGELLGAHRDAMRRIQNRSRMG